MSYWSKLSMKDRANVMKLFLDKGISDLDTMRREYNIFAEGGNTNDADLVDWIIREEGFNKKPEDIGDGKMTLGSGLTSKKWHDLYRKRGNKWSAEDNRMAVAEEVANRRRWAEKTIPNWEALPDSSQKALLSYKYNYDFTPTNSPKLFKALADSNFREAARQMDATSKDPKFKEGLMKRRLREQEWFLSDLANQSIPEPTPAPAPVVINTSLPEITAPAVSTAVANNYVPSSVHPYTRRENARRAMESAAAFNRMIEDTSIQNNLSEYQFPIGNGYANGGKIHIKPENRGKFTALKKRTGHSATWFKEHGTPAQKKMAIFALNAKKWKHGLGGLLEI